MTEKITKRRDIDDSRGVEVTTLDLVETIERLGNLAKQFEEVTPALLMVIPYIAADIEVKESRAAFYRKWINILTGTIVASALGWLGHFLWGLLLPFVSAKIRQHLGGL